MKTNLAGASPIEQFITKLKESGIDIDSTRFEIFKIGTLITQAYLLDGGYRLLLADTRGWLLLPVDEDSPHSPQIKGGMKLLPESEMNKSVEFVLRNIIEPRKVSPGAAKEPQSNPVPLYRKGRKDGEVR
jgi:hypothetical protein